jgi:deoxyribodipyrimidine photolyase-related protein
MEASEYRGRQWQHQRMAEAIGAPVDVVPASQFLFQQYNPFPRAEPDQRVIMEAFYRRMRQHFRVLMDGDEPAGGVWNTDKQNRRPLPAGLTAPRRRSFAPDAITRAALDEVAAGNGFGDATGFDLAVTHDEAAAALDDFIAHRLPNFGAYEDAMTRHDGQVFHSLLSPYLNIGLLEPIQVIRAAEAAYAAGHAPLNSVEGFIRQVLGWREFMAWQYWRQMPTVMQSNAWGAHRPLPEFFWTGETPMNCLHHALERARRDGYAHHIERLMLLTNFATLAGLEPVEVNRWFLSAFVDAYEWVMIPNVLGMGLNADGGRTATKPYIASANYISRMSDYCADCPFDPAARTGDDACPFNALYWNFLITHEQALRSNPRFGPAVLGLNRLDDAERQRVQAQAAAFLDGLTPAALR